MGRVDVAAKRFLADRYEVVGVLGEGGTGVVYDAIRTNDRTSVALKVMHPTLAGDDQIRARFRREAAILRRLEGPHVCPVLDFGEVPGDTPDASLLYIARPKIEGESLASLLARGPLELDRALDVLRSILEALAAAHEQGIVHRDLKPANVLLEGGTKASVVDFGMSKIVTGAGPGTTNLTMHGMVFGTPEYMAPEQARGDDLDARCDVYAAGIILYEMLAGAPPFRGATPLVVLTAHLTSDLELPSTRPGARSRVTPALEAVVVHALARAREDRYSSAKAFAAALLRARAAPNDVGSVRPSSMGLPPAGNDAFAETMPVTVSARPAIDVGAPTLFNDRPLLLPVPDGARLSFDPRRPAHVGTRVPPHASTRSRSGVEPASDLRCWILVWIVVGVASIAAGVWFALRS